MSAIIWAFIRPFLGYIVGAVAIAGVVTSFYFKSKHDGVVQERARVEREKDNAIRKANQERERIRVLCMSNPLSCTPDDWFRD